METEYYIVSSRAMLPQRVNQCAASARPQITVIIPPIAHIHMQLYKYICVWLKCRQLKAACRPIYKMAVYIFQCTYTYIFVALV